MRRLPRLTYLYPIAFFHCVWIFSTVLFSARSRLRVAQLAYGTSTMKSPLPEMPAAEVIGDARQLTLFEVGQVNGNTSLLEQAILARLAETAQPKRIFEFGTFDGRTALNLIAHAPPDAHLFTLDLPASEIDQTRLPIEKSDRTYIDKAESGTRFLGTEYAKRITQLYGDSANFDFSPYFGTIDLVFVDASHAYDYVRSDTLNAMKLLRPSGGLIAWHDYSLDWRGVIRALNEFYRSGGPFQGLRRVEGTSMVVLRVDANSSQKLSP
jgi:predicted O-methyltransferase YrrM